MRVNPQHEKQTLTLDILTLPPPDPNTGASTGAGTSTRVVTQPCSLQVIFYRMRGGGALVDGVNGAPRIYRCYTKAFTVPALPASSVYVWRVDGVYYALENQDVPQTTAGQGGRFQIDFAAPEYGR